MAELRGEIERLRFILHAREFNLPIDDIRELIALQEEPKASCAKAHDIAMAAEQLYREQKLPVDEITQLLKISRSTLYRYLRHQGVVMAGKRR